MTRATGNALLAAASLVIALGLCEVAVRLFVGPVDRTARDRMDGSRPCLRSFRVWAT